MRQVPPKKIRRAPSHRLSNPESCFYAAIKIFGDSWTLFIIDSLAGGEKRFCELERAVTDINPVTLANRLKKLERLGFISRHEHTLDKLSVTYLLTKKGAGILPVLRTMKLYAQKHLL